MDIDKNNKLTFKNNEFDDLVKKIKEENMLKSYPDINNIPNQKMNKKINIAIVGFGNIGSYFYRTLQKNKKIIAKKTGKIPIIKFISAKSLNKKRKISLYQYLIQQGNPEVTKLKVKITISLIAINLMI